MTDTPHFMPMDAYRIRQDARNHPDMDAALADHINAAIAEAVKAEREACAEIAYKACDSVARDYDALTKCKTKSHPRWVQEIGKGFARLCREDAPTAIRARGAK